MARRVERGQRASARTLPSDRRPPFSQPPRPGTPFSVPQPDIHTLPQGGKHLQGSQPPRPGTPFSVPQWGKHLISRNPRDFVPPGLIRPTRHKFTCTKPYEDQRFKKPDAKVTEKLQELKDLIKASANKSTLEPLRDLKENRTLTVPLPLRVPEGMSNPLTRDTRPSVLQPATRKRVASSSVPIPGKVKKSRAVSTGFEEPMDFDQLGRSVPATSTKHSSEDASSNFKEDHTVAGPSSADTSAVPGPSSADPSAVPGPSSADSSAVPGSSSADPSAVPETSSADSSAVPGTSSADPSAVPGQSSADSSAVPGTFCADSSAVPGTSSADYSAVPGPSSADSSAVPGTFCADSSAVPGSPSSDSSAVPGTSSAHSSAVPGTSSADYSAVPGSSSADSFAVPGSSSAESSAGQCEQVISPNIQGSLHPSLSSQGVLGSSTSPPDAQGWSVSHQNVLELTKGFQGSVGHSTSAQASQRLSTCPERKIIHVSSSRRRFKSLSATLQVSKLSTSPPKHVGQDPSGQGDLQQAQSEKDSSKPSSPKSKISDFSFFTNGASRTTSSQESLTCLTAAKAGQRDKSSHKDSQKCSPSSPKCPKQSASSKVSLRTDPADQGDFRTSPLIQEDFQSPTPLKNGLRSSLTVQRGLNAITSSHVSLTTLTPAHVEKKLPTSTPGAQGPLSFSEGVLESSTQTQDVLKNVPFELPHVHKEEV
ncbi:uncharacterized protein LOC143433943 [Arvicanthis niloticus]|uniref:uncharacterized protein LOC143433943 n=1 Tax=Arvicanthis niloticus TaxID=61156 RepID=UPI00402B0A98